MPGPSFQHHPSCMTKMTRMTRNLKSCPCELLAEIYGNPVIQLRVIRISIPSLWTSAVKATANGHVINPLDLHRRHMIVVTSVQTQSIWEPVYILCRHRVWFMLRPIEMVIRWQCYCASWCNIVWVDHWADKNYALTSVHPSEILRMKLITALGWCLYWKPSLLLGTTHHHNWCANTL